MRLLKRSNEIPIIQATLCLLSPRPHLAVPQGCDTVIDNIPTETPCYYASSKQSTWSSPHNSSVLAVDYRLSRRISRVLAKIIKLRNPTCSLAPNKSKVKPANRHSPNNGFNTIANPSISHPFSIVSIEKTFETTL